MRFAPYFMVLLMLVGLAAAADDIAANEAVKRGIALAKAGDDRGAAQAYAEADFMADDPQLKINALKSQIAAYRKCGLLYQEFDAIEKLLTRYPGQADFVALTDREYQIAEASLHGKREPAFWSLRWVPWLTSHDRTVEIYEKALERAPFARAAASGRLRLAFRMDEEGKPEKALEQLRTLIRDYPQAPERKYAMLALGELLFELSKRGDGDGRYNREAIAVFREFKIAYPEAAENDFIDKCLLKSKDIQAARLLGVAKFYERSGRTAAAERYLSTVLKDYPDSVSADESERMLVKLDDTYTPDGYRPEMPLREQTYQVHRIPEEQSGLLIVPENSGGKHLLPVYDLGLDKIKKDQQAGQDAL